MLAANSLGDVLELSVSILRAGIIEERWTPRAAKQAVWAVAQMTPGDAERLFAMLGGMTPSKSTLDRLPK